MPPTTARKRSTKDVESDEWISVLAASKELGETRLRVLNRVVAGELEGKLVAGRTVVTIKSVQRVKAAKAAVQK